MAKKDIFSLNGGTRISAVNLDFKVGVKGENRPADVMLIQSLFRYIGQEANIARRFLGNIRLPKVDGMCGAITLRAIRHFQQLNSRRLLRVDGVIHPASYDGRTIADLAKPVMTIMLMHLIACDVELTQPETNYISGLTRIEPRLGPFLS